MKELKHIKKAIKSLVATSEFNDIQNGVYYESDNIYVNIKTGEITLVDKDFIYDNLKFTSKELKFNNLDFYWNIILPVKKSAKKQEKNTLEKKLKKKWEKYVKNNKQFNRDHKLDQLNID